MEIPDAGTVVIFATYQYRTVLIKGHLNAMFITHFILNELDGKSNVFYSYERMNVGL